MNQCKIKFSEQGEIVYSIRKELLWKMLAKQTITVSKYVPLWTFLYANRHSHAILKLNLLLSLQKMKAYENINTNKQKNRFIAICGLRRITPFTRAFRCRSSTPNSTYICKASSQNVISNLARRPCQRWAALIIVHCIISLQRRDSITNPT